VAVGTNPMAFDGRCIPNPGIARRVHTLGMRASRALCCGRSDPPSAPPYGCPRPLGRLVKNGAIARIRDPRHGTILDLAPLRLRLPACCVLGVNRNLPFLDGHLLPTFLFGVRKWGTIDLGCTLLLAGRLFFLLGPCFACGASADLPASGSLISSSHRSLSFLSKAHAEPYTV
jgi:hypothetical protein